jgi:type IV pilus assembly protein PilE
MKREQVGVTLIELLIVVAIVGILAMVAYPSYQDSVRKTRRADALTGIIALQLAQEQFRGNCPFYAQNLGAVNTCGANSAASTVNASSNSREGYYRIAVSAGSASGNAYTIIATPQGAQVSDTACSPMTLTVSPANPQGLRSPTACW